MNNPSSSLRVAVFGGSFDPIHSGHLGIARRALEDLSLDRLLFVPAKVNPFKAGKDRDAAGLSDAMRWKLVLLAAETDPRFEAWDEELRRGPGPSYAVDTIRAAAARFPGAKLFYLIGEDNLDKLPLWKSFAELAAMCTFVSYPRTVESSTEVRRRLLAGEPLGNLVPPFVADELSRNV